MPPLSHREQTRDTEKMMPPLSHREQTRDTEKMNRVRERHRTAEQQEAKFGLVVVASITDPPPVDTRSTACAHHKPNLQEVVDLAPRNMATTTEQDATLESLDYDCRGEDDNGDSSIAKTAAAASRASPACLASLCLCMLTHSYLLISVFPYAGYMSIYLIESANEETAGSHAGLLASAFMLGRSTTGYLWGKVADSYGRTTVLYLSLGAACFFSIGFGLAPTFASALAFRFCLGAGNGIMATVKTLASDIAKGNEKVEIQAMQLIIGMWAWGFLISPVISGALAEPIRQYPQWEWLQINSVWATILSRHPFLIPNLFGSVLCLVAMLTVWLFVPEPVPMEKRRSVKYILSDFLETCWTCVPAKCRSCRTPPWLGPSYQRVPVQDLHEDDDIGSAERDSPRKGTKSSPAVAADSSASFASIFARKQTRTKLLVYWFTSFISSSLDEIFPLFCISHQAGLGLDEIHIGQVLSVCGLMFACAQYFMYPLIYNRFGLHGAIRIGSMFSAPIMILVPVSVLLNQGAQEGELLPVTFVYLAVVVAISKLFALVFFSSIAVAVNQSVPFEHRGTVNGLSVQGGSIANGLGPTFAGVLVTVSLSVLGKAGSLLIFGTVSTLGGIATLLVFVHVKEGNDDDIDDGGFGGRQSIVDDGFERESSENVELVKHAGLEAVIGDDDFEQNR